MADFDQDKPTTTSTSDKQDNDIAAKVGDITLSNHTENSSQVSTSVIKHESSKDGILDGEEGELDYEEDEGETLDTSDSKQDTPKKTPTKDKGSDVEEGELEDGEVNSDGEEGEILSDKEEVITKKKVEKEEGELNEDDLEDGEVRDQSDYSNQGRGIPRKLCRYFVSGSCTWGVSCRFLHPGVNDKGAYHMLPHPGQYPVPYVRPSQPAFPVVPEKTPNVSTLVSEYDQPEDEPDVSTAPDPKPVVPEKETAWERGIRLAKENKKAAMRRKKEDTDFEQKRMLLNISVDAEEEEGNKENQLKRKEIKERIKKDPDVSERGYRSGTSGSRWRDNDPDTRYHYKDKEKKKRTRSRRSLSSSPERSKYDRRRDSKESPRPASDASKDTTKNRDKDRHRKPKTSDQAKKNDKTSSITSSKDATRESDVVNNGKPSNQFKGEIENVEASEGDKSKSKGGCLGISNDRLAANDEWHDPWQRTTSPKRRSPRRRSTSSYSSRSRSSSSSTGSSRSSRSRSRTPSSTGSGSRSSSRSISRSPSRSPSRTPSETSSRSRSRSGTPSSESDRSSTSSRASERKKENESKPNSVRNQSTSSHSESETPSDSESDTDGSRSGSPVPRKPPSLTRSPGGRGVKNPVEAVPPKERDVKADKKSRVDYGNREERIDKYSQQQQQQMVGWDRRDRWENSFGRGARGHSNKDRESSSQRRRRSRSPPVRRENDARRHFEEAASHREGVDQTRDYNRRDDNVRSSSNASTSDNPSSSKSSTSKNNNLPSNEPWAAERRKRPQLMPLSGSVRYAGHKDIKLTLNKSASKTPASSQAASKSYSPTRQAEASSSSTGTKDSDPKKRWIRPPEPAVSQRHSSPREDVTSSQTSSKPIKRAADSVLTPRQVDTPSNKRIPDDSLKRMVPLRPLKRSADSVPITKRTATETVPIKTQPPREQIEPPTDTKQGHVSNSSRREELLRELKAVEDAIARKRARIE